MNGGALAEALAQAEGEQDVDKKIEQALSCPCLGDLKEGPCGPVFVHAFGCFIRSEHEDKGMDCLPEFAAFQACLQKHPEHVARIMEDPAVAEAAAETAPSEGESNGDGPSATGTTAAAPAGPSSGGSGSGQAAVAASPAEGQQQGQQGQLAAKER